MTFKSSDRYGTEHLTPELFATFAAFPTVGEEGVLYADIATAPNKLYRWNAGTTAYVAVGGGGSILATDNVQTANRVQNFGTFSQTWNNVGNFTKNVVAGIETANYTDTFTPANAVLWSTFDGFNYSTNNGVGGSGAMYMLPTGGAMELSNAGGTASLGVGTGAIGAAAGSPQTFIKTTSVSDATAVAGQVLSLTSATTGEVEFVDAASGIPDWVTAKAYKVNDVVTTEGRTYRALTAHTSGVFNANRANWTVITPLKAGTALANGTYYYNGDIVNYSPDGMFLERNTSGTSGAVFDNPERAQWNPVSSNDTGVWTAALYYWPSQEVTYANKIVRQVTGQVSNATFDSLESAKWVLVQSNVQAWALTTFYFANERVTNNGVVYQRASAGVSGAVFNSAEELNWLRVGAYESNPKTVAAANYTVLANDGVLNIDSTANPVVVLFPSTLADGRQYTVRYIQTANPITFTAGAGTTIVNPASYTPGASFVAGGSVGQYGTTAFFKVGTVWNFLG